MRARRCKEASPTTKKAFPICPSIPALTKLMAHFQVGTSEAGFGGWFNKSRRWGGDRNTSHPINPFGNCSHIINSIKIDWAGERLARALHVSACRAVLTFIIRICTHFARIKVFTDNTKSINFFQISSFRHIPLFADFSFLLSSGPGPVVKGRGDEKLHFPHTPSRVACGNVVNNRKTFLSIFAQPKVRMDVRCYVVTWSWSDKNRNIKNNSKTFLRRTLLSSARSSSANCTRSRTASFSSGRSSAP